MNFWAEILNRFKMRWILLILCGLISAYAQAAASCANSFGSNLSVRYFNGTVNAIAKAVAPRRLVVQFYDQEVFLEAAQNKGFDLAIASSGLTALMTDASGAAALLTIINSRTPDPNHANAGVIVVRSDRDDINCLADLKGKTVAVSSTKAFAGFLAVMGEIQAEGLNPNRLFKSVTATHKPMTELVKQVVNKEVDVAFIASCLLENMEADGVIPKGCLKVINEKKDENFYCKHSTRLYPGWILSAQPTLDSKTLRNIMEALLQLPPGKEEGSYWTVATDYDQMNLLLQRMEVRYLEDRTIGWMLNYYRWYFIVGCGALLLIILNWAYLAFAVRRKTEQLRKKVEENREYERENRKITERIEALEKAKSIGIISAMVAHELKQPLGAINNYSEAILRQLKRGKKPAEEILTEALSEIKSESQRASEIVEFVRNIGRKEPRQRKRFNLESAVEHTIELMKRLGRLNSKCTLTGAENLFVYADPLNVDLVLMNLLKNAEEAVRNQQNAEIKVEIKNAGADALVIIEDNGPDMTDDQFASLRNLGQSSKKDGLGLGLAIVRELLEANGGSLKLVRIPSGGLRCIASLPIKMGLDKLQEKAVVRIIDDDDSMRKSWRFLIEGEGWTTKCYSSALRFLEEDDRNELGCVVLDVRMPDMSGIELQRVMMLQKNGLPIIFVSGHGDIDMAVQALKDGATDFLPKPVSADRLLTAIERAVSKDVERRQQNQLTDEYRHVFDTLTAREKMVAKKVARGLLNKQIADELQISEKTVQVHRGAVCRKLGVKSAVGVASILSILHEEDSSSEDIR